MKKYNTFKDLVIDTLIEKLDEYKDKKIDACDMGYTLLEQYNMDGTYTYNTYESIEIIKEHFEELGEIYDNFICNFGKENSINVFEKPEIFIVNMLLEKADELLNDCKLINENWNSTIMLTDENIEIIVEQLKEM